jgi:hypothetical protein
VRHDGFTPIGAAQLAQMFGLSMVATHQLMRSPGFPSFKVGRSRFTTEPWLAGWMAAQLKNPPPVKSFDPLEDEVIRKCSWAVGELVRQGKLAIVGERIAEPGDTLKRELQTQDTAA